MPERVKKTKCGGGGLRKKNLRGYAREGKRDEMRGGGGLRDNLKGGVMPERVQKTKCGGCCEKKLRGGYAGEGKEDEMQGGLAGKNLGGGV